MPKHTTSITIGEPETAILIALNRFQYLTAAQGSRLLYPNLKDENRYVLRRLKRLVDGSYVLRLGSFQTPRYGSAPHVFTLARKGRHYLTTVGVEITPYYRPGEEDVKGFNRPFMQHTLASIDVLIAAELLCKEYAKHVSCPDMRCERELKRSPLKVDLPAGSPYGSSFGGSRKVAVIPDGWFQLSVKAAPPLSIALELDRGTEDQKYWRRKVAALVVWANGPYREAFETDNITIAVVTPSVERRDQLRGWTVRELEARGMTQDEGIFLFTCVNPVTLPRCFFL